jgi:hypothetical protein
MKSRMVTVYKITCESVNGPSNQKKLTFTGTGPRRAAQPTYGWDKVTITRQHVRWVNVRLTGCNCGCGQRVPTLLPTVEG